METEKSSATSKLILEEACRAFRDKYLGDPSDTDIMDEFGNIKWDLFGNLLAEQVLGPYSRGEVLISDNPIAKEPTFIQKLATLFTRNVGYAQDAFLVTAAHEGLPNRRPGPMSKREDIADKALAVTTQFLFPALYNVTNMHYEGKEVTPVEYMSAIILDLLGILSITETNSLADFAELRAAALYSFPTLTSIIYSIRVGIINKLRKASQDPQTEASQEPPSTLPQTDNGDGAF